MESRRRRIRIAATRWVLYFLVLYIEAALQTMPGFLAIGEFKPCFILGTVLAVAVYEGEFYGALFGAAGGLLWDYLAGRTVGILGLGLMILCFFASVVVQLYLKPSPINFVLLNIGAGIIVFSMDFLFFYLMRGYSAPGVHYLTVILPEVIVSAALAPLTLRLIHGIAERFTILE